MKASKKKSDVDNQQIDNSIFKKIHQINFLMAEIDGIYHQAALKLQVSDSVMCVLYAIYDNGDNCLLSQVYKQSGTSKQTVNSALRKLENMGIIYLEIYKGKSKKICLTKEGIDYVEKTAARLYMAENHAFASWKQEEIDMYISLMKKYKATLQKQVEEL